MSEDLRKPLPHFDSECRAFSAFVVSVERRDNLFLVHRPPVAWRERAVTPDQPNVSWSLLASSTPSTKCFFALN